MIELELLTGTVIKSDNIYCILILWRERCRTRFAKLALFFLNKNAEFFFIFIRNSKTMKSAIGTLIGFF